MVCAFALAKPAVPELPETEGTPKEQQEILKLLLFG
jgi:hypothetical protein